MSKLDISTDKWFVRVNSEEESEAFQMWAFTQGLSWAFGQSIYHIGGSDAISGNFSREGRLGHASPRWYEDRGVVEIFPTFETKVSITSVEIPEVESPNQKRIRELEETIAKAQEQIQELKKEV